MASITRLETWSLGAHRRMNFFFHLKLKEFRLQSEETGLEIWILLTLLIIFSSKCFGDVTPLSDLQTVGWVGHGLKELGN